MNGALSIAATGIASQQRRLDVTADNLANASTNGFKSARLTFQDAMYSAIEQPDGQTGVNLQLGHGVLTAAVSKDFSGGSVVETGNLWDLRIEGEGFFSLRALDGSVHYTKAGSFYTSKTGGQTSLVNVKGQYVLDEYGENIEIAAEAKNVEISLAGEIRFTGDGGFEQSRTLGIYRFVNTGGLMATGGGNYAASAASGAAERAVDVVVHQGSLEQSNVDVAREMTTLIRAQRALSLASRALTTADQMEGIANNLKK